VSVAATSAAGGTAIGVMKAALVFAVSASIGSGVVYVGKQAIAPRAPTPTRHVPAVVTHPPAAAPVPSPAPPEVEAPEVEAPVEPVAPPSAPAPTPKVVALARTPPPLAVPPSPEPVVAPVSPPLVSPLPPPAQPLPPSPPPAPVCDLGRELAAIERAQQWLESAPTQALEAIESLERACPDGTLQPERMTVRALALCALERRDEGLRARRWLEEHAPDSPGMARVRLACP
jgi:hypothetical protein